MKIILVFFSLCLLFLVGAALWVWHQLNQLPINDLSLRPAAISLHSARLHHLSFNYIDGDLRAPVSLESLALNWAWHGLTPQLQDVHADKVHVALNQYPTATPEADDHDIAWPESWRLPDLLPARISIGEFLLTLPCADTTCKYAGELYLHQQEALEVAASIRSGHGPNEAQTVLLEGHYKVTQQRPELTLQIQNIDNFALDLNAVLTPDRRFRGSTVGTLQSVPDWIWADAAQWGIELPDDASLWVQRIPKPLALDGQWHVDMPQQLSASWLDTVKGTLDLDLEAGQQVSVSLHALLQQDPNTELIGQLQAQIEPEILTLFDAQLPKHVQPYTKQLEQPLQLRGEWQLALPHLSGSAQARLELDQAIHIAPLGRLQATVDSSIQLEDGHLSAYQLKSIGTIADLDLADALATWQLNPETLHWTVQADGTSLPSLSQPLALDIELYSTGDTKLNLTSVLDIDLNDFSVKSPLTTLSVRQADWRWQNAHLKDVTLILPFSFDVQDTKFSLSNSASMQLRAETDYASLHSDQAQLSVNNWHASGDLDDLPGVSFDAAAALTLAALTAPQLHTQDISWSGTITGASQQMRSKGRLRNSHGLVLNHEAQLNAQTMSVQWDVPPVFWLAGNPLRTSFNAWPELLTLERGRSSARGELTMAFDTSAVELAATFELADVAGLYDTTSFSGLNSQIDVESDGDRFHATVPSLTLQRVVKGIAIGPVQAQGSYQGEISSPLAGKLQVDENRANVFNGEVSIENATYDFAAESVLFHVTIAQLDLSQLLNEYPASDLTGSGILSGSIPIRWSENGLSIESGTLKAQPPGGELRYQSARAQQLGERNQAMKLVVDALEDFHYSLLESTVSYYDDGTLELALAIEGHNPTWQHNRPVHLTVRLQEDLPALIASLQLTNQVNSIIQERVQKRLLESLRR
ncbi:YdbH domain-containing protein [Aliidiomarina sp. Khilg15.8]